MMDEDPKDWYGCLACGERLAFPTGTRLVLGKANCPRCGSLRIRREEAEDPSGMGQIHNTHEGRIERIDFPGL